VIFHTKYPKNFRAPPFGAIFLSAPPPLTWNPGSAPEIAVWSNNAQFTTWTYI
jgi:hypothetical protein